VRRLLLNGGLARRVLSERCNLAVSEPSLLIRTVGAGSLQRADRIAPCATIRHGIVSLLHFYYYCRSCACAHARRYCRRDL